MGRLSELDEFERAVVEGRPLPARLGAGELGQAEEVEELDHVDVWTATIGAVDVSIGGAYEVRDAESVLVLNDAFATHHVHVRGVPFDA